MSYSVFKNEFLGEENVGGIKKIKPKIAYSKQRQTGKSVKSIDAKRTALQPGKRISKNGKVYYEYRKSRSDLKGINL